MGQGTYDVDHSLVKFRGIRISFNVRTLMLVGNRCSKVGAKFKKFTYIACYGMTRLSKMKWEITSDG